MMKNKEGLYGDIKKQYGIFDITQYRFLRDSLGELFIFENLAIAEARAKALEVKVYGAFPEVDYPTFCNGVWDMTEKPIIVKEFEK